MTETLVKPGDARCVGTSWADLVKADARPVPEFLAEEHYEYLGSEPIAADRYTSPEFFKQEVTKMWPRVWQFAAREEDIPEPGDYIVYENVGRSYLVCRQADGSVRAFHNVCMHRGRKLRTQDGNTKLFKCPFHGFTWNNDGTLAQIPCRWDFPHLTDEKMSLPEASVGRWAGYIFVREAADGPSLEEYLAPLSHFFDRWAHDDCSTVVWVGKVVPANWKVTMEAFMEAWHSVVTHPQILPFTGDANTAYSNWGDNVNLALSPFAIPSPHISLDGKPQQWIVDEFLKYNGRAGGADLKVEVPEGESARAAMAAVNRTRFGEQAKRDFDFVTDAELLDALVYNVFPNFAPWGGFMPNIVYRWRPWPDQDRTLMEVRILMRVPKGEKAPPSVQMNLLRDDQPWTAAPELGALAPIFDQDMANLGEVQAGLKCSKNNQVNLGNYQEIRVRQFHRTIDKYIDGR